MLTVLVANTKGGCGKTTISTHLAAALACDGHRTALADADRQRSSLEWARLRPGTAAPIAAIDWSKDLTKVPKGVDRLVIDAPAAMRKKHAFELVAMADLIVVPVLPSVFDQGSTTAFLAQLHQLKAVRKNQKPVGVLRNRVRARTRATARLAQFLGEIEHADLGAHRPRAVQRRRRPGPVDLRSARQTRRTAPSGLGAAARLCRTRELLTCARGDRAAA